MTGDRGAPPPGVAEAVPVADAEPGMTASTTAPPAAPPATTRAPVLKPLARNVRRSTQSAVSLCRAHGDGTGRTCAASLPTADHHSPPVTDSGAIAAAQTMGAHS